MGTTKGLFVNFASQIALISGVTSMADMAIYLLFLLSAKTVVIRIAVEMTSKTRVVSSISSRNGGRAILIKIIKWRIRKRVVFEIPDNSIGYLSFGLHGRGEAQRMAV